MAPEDFNIENTIIKEFQNIAEKPREDKVNIEHSPEVERFSKMLFEDTNWHVLLTIIKRGLEKSIIVPSYVIGLSDMEEYVRILAEKQYECSLQYVSMLRSQISGMSNEMYRYVLEKLREFLNKRILLLKPEVLKICNCGFRIEENDDEEICKHCKSRILKLFKCTVNKQIKKSIYNNQFLEVYVKECLREADLKLIYVESQGKKVSTSITYIPWPNRPVEIDVAAVKGSYVVICECKTGKVTQNTVDKKLLKVDTLIKRIQEPIQKNKIKVYYFLITTDYVDPSLKAASDWYTKNYGWLAGLKAVERNEIPNLRDIVKKQLEGAR
ncbi:MAG: hypothetical protein ACTSR0_01595 [Candidatus Asgardarchaeia archaeon]